ncbi:phosphoribosylamine--glycine ligase [Lacticaseibacillus nasuensis]|uniref:phosphoribosylamine--glycine ligase n=1 Tax=Lacticaseibacillus nasuensis TaxID=944671 RepID=UPI0022463B7F|nr:phosphoribosylamine--glycine ligase [Lacticaseibacillus nasuensis]MCX2454754.1 phosphoribosylamine--glycine ligase [Lacticaseibacillus nasuensis]
MAVLIIGNGARESALGKAFLQSPAVSTVYVAPGNGGMPLIGLTPVAISEFDFPALIAFAQTHAVDFTFVGPEAPLAAGIVDAFEAAGLPVFGPRQAVAQLEASKQFAKAFMRRHGLPTADARVVKTLAAAQAAVAAFGLPVVIKADGLAAGKGVVVAETAAQATATLRDIYAVKTPTVVIEAYLQGQEASVLALYHDEHHVTLPLAQDHKRRNEGDKGPNTGGMGAISPAPQFTDTEQRQAQALVTQTLSGMVAEGLTGTGVLYIGLMFTATGPQILEYNLRFGDPETQVLLPQVTNDWYDLIATLLAGETPAIQLNGRTYCAVVAAHPSYPGTTKPALPVITPSTEQTAYWLPAGVAATATGLKTHGGRVFTVVGEGADLAAAQASAYARLAPLQGELAARSDIGWHALA